MGGMEACNSHYCYKQPFLHTNKPPIKTPCNLHLRIHPNHPTNPHHAPSALPALDASLQLGKLLRGGADGSNNFGQALAGLDKRRDVIHLLPPRHGQGGRGKQAGAAALEQAAAAGGPT